MGEIIDPEQYLWRKHKPVMPEDIEIPPLSVWELAELCGRREKTIIRDIKKGRLKADCIDGSFSISHMEAARYMGAFQNLGIVLLGSAIFLVTCVIVWAIVIAL